MTSIKAFQFLFYQKWRNLLINYLFWETKVIFPHRWHPNLRKCIKNTCATFWMCRLYSNFELHYTICYENVWHNWYHWIIAILKFKGNEYYRFMTSGFDRKYSSTLYYVVCCHVSVLFACLYSNHRLSHWLHALSSTLCTTSNANVYFHTRYLFANKMIRK